MKYILIAILAVAGATAAYAATCCDEGKCCNAACCRR